MKTSKMVLSGIAVFFVFAVAFAVPKVIEFGKTSAEYLQTSRDVRKSGEKQEVIQEEYREKAVGIFARRMQGCKTQEVPNKVVEDPDLTSEALVANGSFESGVVSAPNKLEIKEVNRPIFQVYLGEPFTKLDERFWKEFGWALWFAHEKQPNMESVVESARLPREDGCLWIYTCVPCDERVVWLTMDFKDTHVDRYNEIKESLQKLYPGVKWTAQEKTDAHWEFKGLAKIDGVDVFVWLQRKVIDRETALGISYCHWPLYTKTFDEIQYRRAKKLKDNL